MRCSTGMATINLIPFLFTSNTQMRIVFGSGISLELYVAIRFSSTCHSTSGKHEQKQWRSGSNNCVQSFRTTTDTEDTCHDIRTLENISAWSFIHTDFYIETYGYITGYEREKLSRGFSTDRQKACRCAPCFYLCSLQRQIAI
jgi:hypothetical protein